VYASSDDPTPFTYYTLHSLLSPLSARLALTPCVYTFTIKSSKTLLASFSKGVSPVSLFVGGSRSRNHHGSAIIRGGNCPFRSSSSANRRLFTLLLPPTLASRRYITTRTTTTANMGATEAKHDGGGDGKPDDEVPTETTEATSLEPTSNEANDAIDTLTSKLERLQVDEEEIPASLKKVAKWIESKKATRILVCQSTR
jgi:hypothetical protein